jgi:hypothetical protein
MTDYQRITVSPIAGALGAEIGGVDISVGPTMRRSPRSAARCSRIW